MRAIVHRIDHDIDAAALADYAMLWLHDGFALAALGQSLTIDVPANERATAAERADTALSAIECDGDVDTYGTGPLAFAALPFATERAATIVVPEIIYGRDLGGTRWITWIGDGAAPSREQLVARLTMPGGLHEHPRTFTVSSARTERSWRESVAAVRDQLRAGHARKAVTRREQRWRKSHGRISSVVASSLVGSSTSSRKARGPACATGSVVRWKGSPSNGRR